MVKKLLSIFTALVMTAAIIAVPSFASTQTVLASQPLDSGAIYVAGADNPNSTFTYGPHSDSSSLVYSAEEKAQEMFYKGTGNSNVYYLRSANITGGKIPSGAVVSYKFKLKKVNAGVLYIPVSFYHGEKNINNVSKTVYIQDGVLYATRDNSGYNGNQVDPTSTIPDEICAVKPDVWYTVKMLVNYDQTGTNEATYKVYVTDGAKEYTSANTLKLGIPAMNWGFKNTKITSLDTIAVGYVTAKGIEGADTTGFGDVFMKDILIYTTDDTSEFESKTLYSTTLNYGSRDVSYNNSNSGKFTFPWENGVSVAKGTSDKGTVAKTTSASNFGRIKNAAEGPDFTNTFNKGNYTVSADFKFNQLTDAVYAPITFQTNKSQGNYRYSAVNIVASNGKLYAWTRKDGINSKYSWTGHPGFDTAASGAYTYIADIDSTKTYNISVTINVDGDSATYDTYSYVIDDGTQNYVGGPYALGHALHYNASDQDSFNMTNITGINLGNAIAYKNSVTASVEMDNFKLDGVGTPLSVESTSVANNETDVDVSKTLSVTFDRALGDFSKELVTLTKDGAQVSTTNTLSEDKKTLKIVPQGGILSGSANYVINIPKNVVDSKNVSVSAAKTISFTTAQAPDYIVYNDCAELPGTSNGYAQTGTSEEITAVTEDTRTALKLVSNYGIDSNLTNIRYQNEKMTAGNYIIEGTFKMTEASAKYFPIAFVTDKGNEIYPYSYTKTVWAEGGALYAKTADFPAEISGKYYYPGKVKICDLDTSAWYTIRISVNIDGDAKTVDTYSYKVTDGTNTYEGGPYALGQAVNDYADSAYNMTKVSYVVLGAACKNTASSESAAVTFIDRFYAVKQTPMTASVSGKTVTFSEAVEPRTLTSVTLTKGGVKYPFTYSLSQDKKTVTVNTKELLGDYTLTIPANVVSAANKALANALTATISETASAQVTKTASKTGNIMVVTAVCKNTSSTAQTIKVEAKAGDAQASVTKLFKAGEEKTFTMTLKTAADSAAVTAYAADGSVLASN